MLTQSDVQREWACETEQLMLMKKQNPHTPQNSRGFYFRFGVACSH